MAMYSNYYNKGRPGGMAYDPGNPSGRPPQGTPNQQGPPGTPSYPTPYRPGGSFQQPGGRPSYADYYQGGGSGGQRDLGQYGEMPHRVGGGGLQASPYTGGNMPYKPGGGDYGPGRGQDGMYDGNWRQHAIMRERQKRKDAYGPYRNWRGMTPKERAKVAEKNALWRAQQGRQDEMGRMRDMMYGGYDQGAGQGSPQMPLPAGMQWVWNRNLGKWLPQQIGQQYTVDV